MFRLKQQLLVLDKSTASSGNIYPTPVVKAALANLPEGFVWGDIKSPGSYNYISLDESKIAFYINNFVIEDGILFGDVHYSHTPEGVILKNLPYSQTGFTLVSLVRMTNNMIDSMQIRKAAAFDNLNEPDLTIVLKEHQPTIDTIF